MAKEYKYFSLSTTNSYEVSETVQGLSVPCAVCEKREFEVVYKGLTLSLPSGDARKYTRSGWPRFIGSLHHFAVSREVYEWIQEVGFTGLRFHRLEVEIENGGVAENEYFVLEPVHALNIDDPKEGFKACESCGILKEIGYGLKSGIEAHVSPGEGVLDFYKCARVYPGLSVIGEKAYDTILEKWTGNTRDPEMRAIVTVVCDD